MYELIYDKLAEAGYLEISVDLHSARLTTIGYQLLAALKWEELSWKDKNGDVHLTYDGNIRNFYEYEDDIKRGVRKRFIEEGKRLFMDDITYAYIRDLDWIRKEVKSYVDEY